MTGYFLYHSIGTYPGKRTELREELSAFADLWSAPDDGQWPTVLGLRQEFRTLWAQVLGTSADQISITDSVTAGLYSIVGSLSPEALRGRTVLTSADCFPSLHFLLQRLAPRFGFTLRTVPIRPGQRWVEDDDFLEAWDDSVALALVTWVTSTASKRANIDRLAERTRGSDSLLVLDVTQGIGLLPFALQPGISFVISTSLKWLCGTSGAGIIWTDAALLPHLTPEFCGWFSQDNPMNWDLDTFAYAGDARRFDNGTPSSVGQIASLPGLRHVLQQDPETVWTHNQTMIESLIECGQHAGWSLQSPIAEDRRGGTFVVSAGSADHATEVVYELRARQLYVDHRGPNLRISPGLITTETARVDLATQLVKRLDPRTVSSAD